MEVEVHILVDGSQFISYRLVQQFDATLSIHDVFTSANWILGSSRTNVPPGQVSRVGLCCHREDVMELVSHLGQPRSPEPVYTRFLAT
jgi:hypothetical protein